MTDKDIIDLYKKGEETRAFNEIVKSYSERMYWHIRRFSCSHEDTDDLVQETFVKIWAALPSFREESRLFTWIYRIATNEALNFLRKKKLKALLTFEDFNEKVERQIDEDVYFNGNDLQKSLLKAIQRLPEKQKLVFMMRYFDDMKYEEISEILKTSVSSLKTSYHYAYLKIKEDLQQEF